MAQKHQRHSQTSFFFLSRKTFPVKDVDEAYSLFNGYAHLSAGLACGLANLAAGFAIGIVGDAGVRASAQQPRLYVGMVLILIFAEALGLYGLIVAIILQSKVAFN